MRLIVLILILQISGQICFGQAPAILTADHYEKGVYKSFEEFLDNAPSIHRSFKVEPYKAKRYDITFKDSVVSKKEKREIWGFSTGDSIYINARNYQAANGFVKLEAVGRYCYFQDQVSANAKQPNNFVAYGVIGGLAGGLVGGAIGSINSRTPIILNINNGKFFYATLDIMELILKSDRDILERFQNDKNHNDVEVKWAYLSEYNANNKNEIDGVGIEDAKVIFYRRDKKQINDSLNIKIRGKIVASLVPNDIIEIEVLDPNEVEVCSGYYCTELNFNPNDYNYVECSWTKKEQSVDIVKEKVGKYYFNKLSYLKQKREEGKN